MINMYASRGPHQRKNEKINRRPRPSGGEGQHEPTQNESRGDEAEEYEDTETYLGRTTFSHQQCEHPRNKGGKSRQNHKMASHRFNLGLPPGSDIVSVEQNEHVEKSGYDQERVSVLVCHGLYLPHSPVQQSGGEIR